jgi:hypothetical protein
MRFLSISVGLLLVSQYGFAQSDRSTITGTISDPAGAVVASAALEARNLSTGVNYKAASTATGNYGLAELPVGSYEFTVSVPGFKKYVRRGLDVQAAQTYRVDELGREQSLVMGYSPLDLGAVCSYTAAER